MYLLLFKVLLPLVNVPMIDYTLAWLESVGVEEVFVFCCAHSKLVVDYLKDSQWLRQPAFSVQTIESHDSISAGDALRRIYDLNVVSGSCLAICLSLSFASNEIYSGALDCPVDISFASFRFLIVRELTSVTVYIVLCTFRFNIVRRLVCYGLFSM